MALNKDLITKVKSPKSRPSATATMIPSRIRDYFSLKSGDTLLWSVLGDVIVIKKIQSSSRKKAK